jgi:hypothetical protein
MLMNVNKPPFFYFARAARGQLYFPDNLGFMLWYYGCQYLVERIFGGMNRWFHCGTRYVGLAKTHAQHLLEAIAYN